MRQFHLIFSPSEVSAVRAAILNRRISFSLYGDAHSLVQRLLILADRLLRSMEPKGKFFCEHEQLYNDLYRSPLADMYGGVHSACRTLLTPTIRHPHLQGVNA